jgi:hypothetical protein
LYEPDRYGFSDEELSRISWQVGGGSFDNQALKAASAADAILFLISPWTLDSTFQKNELRIALTNKRFVPCIVADGMTIKQLPPEFKLQNIHVRKLPDNLPEAEIPQSIRTLIADVVGKAKLSRWRLLASRVCAMRANAQAK